MDIKESIINQIKYTSANYLKDLGFIPDDKLSASPMGSARPPLEFTAECAGFNFYAARAINGEEQEAPTQEVRDAYFAAIDTREKANEALSSSAEALITAVQGADMSSEVSVAWGEPMPVARLATMCSYHMMYHDGQLNYIQTLYGDSESH